MKLNWRWLVQAGALLVCIASLSTLFDASKVLFSGFAFDRLPALVPWMALFALGFFLLLFTSYLKQRASATLRHRLPFFETVVRWLGLQDYREESSRAPARRGRAG